MHNCWVARLCRPARQDARQVKNSYGPVDDKESFATVHGRMAAAKAGIMKRRMDLLEEWYDLSDHPASGVVMDRTNPMLEGCEGLRILLTPFPQAAVQ